MKPNNCEILFLCGDIDNDCVYYVDDGRGCKYFDVDYYDAEICKSKVAQVNRLTIELKRIMEEK